ncbi:MAG: hypothetical protein KF823_11390 [Xanthomonadales bacterium]|nr:hypothetical protein [Xanthomonadales bacterium]
MSTTHRMAEPSRPLDLSQESVTQLHALLPETVAALRRNLNCGDPEVEVAAAEAVLDIALMPEAAYSFVGHISNQTNYTLRRSKKDSNGSWETDPADTIGPGGTSRFTLHYDGFHFTGDVAYKADGIDGEFTMKWSIPLFGDNSISDSTSISGTAASHEGGRGWHAEVWYFLTAV